MADREAPRGAPSDALAAGKRKENEPPQATAEWGWRYHHMGIPTKQPRDGERFLEALGMHVTGFETSPYGVEWMRFEADSPIPEIIQQVPHIAFEVDDLEVALVGKEILVEPTSPSSGVAVAMILHNGMPVELLQLGGLQPDPRDSEPGVRG